MAMNMPQPFFRRSNGKKIEVKQGSIPNRTGLDDMGRFECVDTVQKQG